MNRRMESTVVCGATLATIAGMLMAGCGGGGSTLHGAPLIYPETATLAVGRSAIFSPGTLEVDQHKASEGFRIQEKDGGSFVSATAADYGGEGAVVYTAPAQPGTYHLQWVWDAGTKSEKAATATITVTTTPTLTTQ